MLRLFWQWLAAGGLMLVGNFAPHNPTRAYMEWIGNWYLTYRTTEDLERLALRAEIPKEHFSITSEPLGVDLFLLACKRKNSVSVQKRYADYMQIEKPKLGMFAE